MSNFHRRSALLAAICLCGQVMAGTHAWVGPTNGNWSVAGNWAGGLPTSGESGGTIVQFGTNTTSNMDISSLVVDQIHFTGSGNTINGTQTLGISGSILVVNIQDDAGGNTLSSSLTLQFVNLVVEVAVSTGTTTIFGNIGGTVGLIVNSTGTLALAGNNNTYVGTTSVLKGTLQLNSSGVNTAIPGNLIIGQGTGIANNAIVRLLHNEEIADAVSITINNDGQMDLNGFTESVGPLTVNDGDITIGSGQLLPTTTLTMSGGSITATTGSVSLGGDITATSSSVSGASIFSNVSLNANRTFTVNAGPKQPDFTINGIVSDGSGKEGFVKTGAGTMSLLGGVSNTYTGTTTVNKGTLQLNFTTGFGIPGPLAIGNNTDPANSAILRELQSSDISSTAPVTINASGQFDVNGHSDTIGSLTGVGAVTLGSGTLTIGLDNTSTAFNGIISGTGSVFKSGTGTLTFNQNNSYSGSTFVLTGTLLVNGSQFASAVSVVNGATLGGTGTVGAVTVTGSTLAPGVSGPGTLSMGNLSLDSASSINIDINNATLGAFDQLNVIGTVSLGGCKLNLTVAPAFVKAAGTQITILANDANDAITGTFNNLPEGATVTLGSLPATLSYVGGTGNDVTFTVRNAPPVIASQATATPSPAGVGQLVNLNVSASDANGDTLSFAWDFGDGTTGIGASPSHAYSAAGVYTVNVTVTDGQGGSVASSTSVTVNVPIVGTGPDSDGDGFSDSFEAAAGTDPNNPNDTPTGQPASAGSILPLTLSKPSIKLNFTGGGKDTISFSGTVDVPAGFVPAGAKVQFDVSGVVKAFTLTSKNSAVSGGDSLKVGIKSVKGNVAAQTAKFAASFKHGSFAAALANAGLVGTADAKNVPVTVVFTMIFNKQILQTAQKMSYTAQKGKTGAAK